MTFNSTGAVSTGTTTITNTVNQNFTIQSLTYSQSSNRHNTSIGAGTSLNVNGGNVGVTNGTVVMSGGGSFSQTTSGGTFQVGNSGNDASLDMSGLGTFTADLGTTGIFRAGRTNSNVSGGSNASSITLATTSTITAGTVGIGDEGGTSDTRTLKLGSGVNTINANEFNVGRVTTSSANGRSSGSVTFNTGSGSLVLRDASGGTTGAINMVNTNSNTSSTINSTINLTGHSADVSVAALNMALRSESNNAGNSNATLSFDTGVLAAGTLNLARNAHTGTSTATINIGGGNASFGNITMANASKASGTANATINLTGGTTTITGDIVKTGGAGTTNASVAISGGNLISSGTTRLTGANVTLSEGSLRLNGDLSGSLQSIAAASGSTTGSNFLMSGGLLNLTIAGAADFDRLLGGGTTAGTFEIASGVLDLTGSTLAAGNTISSPALTPPRREGISARSPATTRVPSPPASALPAAPARWRSPPFPSQAPPCSSSAVSAFSSAAAAAPELPIVVSPHRDRAVRDFCFPFFA